VSIPSSASSAAPRERVVHEARTVAGLSHTHNVLIHRVGDAGGFVVFVMATSRERRSQNGCATWLAATYGLLMYGTRSESTQGMVVVLARCCPHSCWVRSATPSTYSSSQNDFVGGGRWAYASAYREQMAAVPAVVAAIAKARPIIAAFQDHIDTEPVGRTALPTR